MLFALQTCLFRILSKDKNIILDNRRCFIWPVTVHGVSPKPVLDISLKCVFLKCWSLFKYIYWWTPSISVGLTILIVNIPVYCILKENETALNPDSSASCGQHRELQPAINFILIWHVLCPPWQHCTNVALWWTCYTLVYYDFKWKLILKNDYNMMQEFFSMFLC